MDRFCRGCLVRYEEPTELIQYTEKNRRLFVYSTGIQVKRTDAFTFQLCKDCYLNMKVACNFKKQCRNSDKRFKSYLGLKENGEVTDLSTFLKNNDDSWAFRFPGNSTPAYQRVKDEDNESTTTSIRNFMMDMMPDDDLPDTEARIIKEVIDEEADVLDDSLDSHWLQDDASIDTDFNLNFSFSPFSTPRPVNNDRYTPKKPTSSKVTVKKEKPEVTIEDSNAAGNLDMPLIEVESNALIPVKVERNFDETTDSFDTVNEFLQNENNFMKDDDYLKGENIANVDTEQAPQCTIDRNLEEALKNTENNEFSLDQLLVSPKVIPGIKSPPTPLINNILFGDKLDIDEDSNSSQKIKSGQTIETFENVTGDVEMTEEFSMEVKLEELDIEELKTKIIDEIDEQANIDNEINITNFYCNMCRKTFKNLKSLKQHYRRHFKDKLRPKFICDQCGKQCNERTNFVRHIQTHTRPPPPKYECSICKLEFVSKNNLNQHKRTHMGEERQVNKKKRFVCQECGLSMDKKSNFDIHMRRHNKTHTHPCPECDKSFYRKADLNVHMRYHTGEKPFSCTYCHMRFVRRDGLTRHVKWHLDLRPFQCQYCKTGFTNKTDLKNHVKKSVLCKATRDNVVKNQKELKEISTTKTIVTEVILENTKNTPTDLSISNSCHDGQPQP